MRAIRIVIAAAMLLASSSLPAHAIPAFARKYGTSCPTGDTVFHPVRDSSGAKADNGASIVEADTIAEAHLWAGGSFSERTTFFGELVASTHGEVSVENAQVLFNDLIAPHAI